MSTSYAIAASPTIDRTTVLQRAAFALNAMVGVLALSIQFAKAATTADPRFHSVVRRIANELCYFTIQSNLIVVAVCVVLAVRPAGWRWFAGTPRLVGLVCITITGVIYHLTLASDQHYVGIAKFADVPAHTVSPVVFVGTWALLGPHGQLARDHVPEMLVFPALWITRTLTRGAIIHVYPYDFADVGLHGYLPVLATIVGLTGVAVALAAAAVRFDRRSR